MEFSKLDKFMAKFLKFGKFISKTCHKLGKFMVLPLAPGTMCLQVILLANCYLHVPNTNIFRIELLVSCSFKSTSFLNDC